MHELFHGAGAAHEGGGAGVAEPEFPFVAVGDVEQEGPGLQDAEFFGEVAEVGVEFAAFGIGRGFGEQAGDDPGDRGALEVGEFGVKILGARGDGGNERVGVVEMRSRAGLAGGGVSGAGGGESGEGGGVGAEG